MTLPKIRLYRLNRGAVWYADTKRANGRRWQFSTHEEDESTARAFAVAKVAGEFGDSSGSGTAAPEATDAGGVTSDAPPARGLGGLADKIRAAAGGNAAGGAVATGTVETPTDDPPDAPSPTPEGEMLADIVAMMGTLGIQSAVARAVRRRRWKEGGRSGHMEPGPPNEKCVETLQLKLRDRAMQLFGTVGLDGWFGVGVFAAGVGISMVWNAEQVEDQADAEAARAAAGRPAESGAHETPAEAPPPNASPVRGGGQGGVAVSSLSIFPRQ